MTVLKADRIEIVHHARRTSVSLDSMVRINRKAAGLNVFRLGRLALVAAVGITCGSMALYPGGTYLDPSMRGYSIFLNSLSDLGSRRSWSGTANPASWFYTVGALMFVVGTASCLLGLLRVYSRLPGSRGLVRGAGALLSLTALAMIGVAFAPQDQFQVLHGGLTLFAIGSFPLASLLLGIATLKGNSRWAPFSWFTLAIVIALWGASIFGKPQTKLQLAVPVTLQKIVAICIIVTLAAHSKRAERLSKE